MLNYANFTYMCKTGGVFRACAYAREAHSGAVPLLSFQCLSSPTIRQKTNNSNNIYNTFMQQIKTLPFNSIIAEARRIEQTSPGPSRDTILYHTDSRHVEWLFAMHAKGATVSFISHRLRDYRWRVDRSLMDFVVRNPELRKEYDFYKCRDEELNVLDQMTSVFCPVNVHFASLNSSNLWLP